MSQNPSLAQLQQADAFLQRHLGPDATEQQAMLQRLGLDSRAALISQTVPPAIHLQTPLALPVIVTGVRTAATEVIASATLAAFIGSGGLGLYIVRGFSLFDIPILLVGAIPVALLTLVVELLLSGLHRLLEPPH